MYLPIDFFLIMYKLCTRFSRISESRFSENGVTESVGNLLKERKRVFEILEFKRLKKY